MNQDLDLLSYRVGRCFLMSLEDIFVPKDSLKYPYDILSMEMSLLKYSCSSQINSKPGETLHQKQKELRLNQDLATEMCA